jgi:hypothetical protein
VANKVKLTLVLSQQSQIKVAEMNDGVADNRLARHINSFPKLRFLLSLQQHPNIKGTCQEFGERLYFGHTPLMDEMINELYSAGLIERIENCYQLSHDPEVLSCLQYLAGAFESPLTRHQVLDRMRPSIR